MQGGLRPGSSAPADCLRGYTAARGAVTLSPVDFAGRVAVGCTLDLAAAKLSPLRPSAHDTARCGAGGTNGRLCGILVRRGRLPAATSRPDILASTTTACRPMIDVSHSLENAMKASATLACSYHNDCRAYSKMHGQTAATVLRHAALPVTDNLLAQLHIMHAYIYLVAAGSF